MRESASIGVLSCVGALIRDARHRVYVHRRTNERRLLPGTWDVVGGHVEPGESPEQALAREITEETGWKLRRIEAVLADWEWEWGGVVRHELDYLVEVDGDLAAPRLEPGKHDAYAWVGPDDLDLLMEGRTDNDRRLRDIVAAAVRTRLTTRLRMEPIGSRHVEDLRTLHDDEGVARWYAGSWTAEQASGYATRMEAAWESSAAGKWMAYARATGELVGRGGLTRLDPDGDVTRQISAVVPDAGWERDRLEVGWAVLSRFWGQGLATEIGRAALAFAAETLDATQVIAYTERHNVRSRAVMERLGMAQVGEITTTGLVEGRDGVHPEAPFAVYATTALPAGRR